MHRVIAAAIGLGASEVYSSESPTGLLTSYVTKGRQIDYVVEGGPPSYFYHGISMRGLPKFSAVLNIWVKNQQQILTSTDNFTCMGYWVYPNEVVGAGSAVCGGLGHNRSFGWVMHRNGNVNYAVLFQNSGWADTGVLPVGGLHIPRMVCITREGGQWFAYFNGVKTGAWGSFGPTHSGSEAGIMGGGNSLWQYACIAAYWERVLTPGEIYKLNSMLRNTRGIDKGLAA